MTTTQTHQTIEGETLSYDQPTGELAAFFARVQQAAIDPSVSEDAMVALIYGRENPLLNHAMLPGHSMVTAETLKQPLHRVMLDLLGRKRVQVGSLDVAAAEARYTLSVTEAAERLGVHGSAVRQAIQAGRLPAWKKAGQYFLDPASVASFQLARRGPPPRLSLRVGSAPGLSFRVRHQGELEGKTSPERDVVEGMLASWKRIAVIFGSEGKMRLFVLEPGGEENEVKHGPFFVKGRFTIAERINNPGKAADAWKAFEAS